MSTNFCVLIKIARRMVSFWYQTEGKSYTALVIKEANEIPLFFYVNGNDFLFGETARDRYFSNDPNAFGNYFEIVKDPSLHFTISGNKKPVKQLFYYAVEKYLSHFINTVLYKSESIETYRNQFPLRFIFEPDIEEKEKALVESLFTDAGYTNVQRLEYNESLFEVLHQKEVIDNNDAVIKLTGIDNNLYAEVYATLSSGLTGQIKIEGQGSDPRVRILAEMILEYIILQNPFLTINKDAEVAFILPYASGLVQNIYPVIKGDAVLSDGKPYFFRVTERNLNEQLLFLSGDNVLYSAIDDLIETYGLDVQSTKILLEGKEINTGYFFNRLQKKYPNVQGISTADNLEAMRMIFLRIAEAGYGLQPNVPITPPALPRKSELKTRNEVVPPKLPPPNPNGRAKPALTSTPPLPPKKDSGNIQPPPLPGTRPPLPPKK
jgi:hypothetical protein